MAVPFATPSWLNSIMPSGCNSFVSLKSVEVAIKINVRATIVVVIFLVFTVSPMLPTIKFIQKHSA